MTKLNADVQVAKHTKRVPNIKLPGTVKKTWADSRGVFLRLWVYGWENFCGPPDRVNGDR